jgi:ATP-dependent Clp protease ATP-binding subunit ClpC
MGADMFERFTNRARRVVVLAQEEARLLNHNYIGTEHLLLGILAIGEGTALRALDEMGITLDIVRQQVEQIIGVGQQRPSGHIPFTPRAKKVLELSLREALQLGHNYIGTEHLLLGTIREGHGVGAQILTQLGGDLSVVRMHVIRLTAAAGEDPESGDVEFADTRVAVARRSDVLEMLSDISARLAIIEAHLGIARPAPGTETGSAADREPGGGEVAGGELGAADAGGAGPDVAAAGEAGRTEADPAGADDLAEGQP